MVLITKARISKSMRCTIDNLFGCIRSMEWNFFWSPYQARSSMRKMKNYQLSSHTMDVSLAALKNYVIFRCQLIIMTILSPYEKKRWFSKGEATLLTYSAAWKAGEEGGLQIFQKNVLVNLKMTKQWKKLLGCFWRMPGQLWRVSKGQVKEKKLNTWEKLNE